MKQKICYSCEAVCTSLSEDCTSCGSSLSPKTLGTFNPLPFIAAVCAAFLMIGVMIGTAA